MTAVGVVAAAGLLAGLALLARPPVALSALLVALLLVPAPLVVPNGVSSLPTFGRVVLVAALAGLLRCTHRTRRTEEVLRIGPVHLGLAALVLTTAVVGVGLAAALTDPAASLAGLVGVVEQALTFVVVLGWARLVGPPVLARALVAVLAVLVLIGVVEQVTGWSWGAFWFTGIGSQQGLDAAGGLAVRAGMPRVRAAAEFALEYGWVLAALAAVPLAVATVRIGRTRWAHVALTGLAALGIVLSVTRTAAVGVAVVVLLVVVLRRDHALTGIALAGVAVAAVVLLSLPDLGGLSLAVDEGSVTARTQRLPEVLALAGTRPLVGLGLAGLDPFGLPTTDATFLLAFAEVGVVGLGVLLGAVAVPVLHAARAAVGRDEVRSRHLAAAAAVGMVALVAGSLVYDAFSLGLSARTFWVLAALGWVAAGPPRTWDVRPVLAPAPWRRVPLVVAVMGLGALTLLPPTGVSTTLQVATIAPLEEALAGYDPVAFGQPRIQVACELFDRAAEAVPGTAVSCRDPERAAGVAEVRITAPDADAVAALRDRVAAPAGRALPDMVVRVIDPVAPTPPSVGRLAWVWLGLAGGLVIMLVDLPLRPRRRARRAAVEPPLRERVRPARSPGPVATVPAVPPVRPGPR